MLRLQLNAQEKLKPTDEQCELQRFIILKNSYQDYIKMFIRQVIFRKC